VGNNEEEGSRTGDLIVGGGKRKKMEKWRKWRSFVLGFRLRGDWRENFFLYDLSHDGDNQMKDNKFETKIQVPAQYHCA
jgi:hypothetical protein